MKLTITQPTRHDGKRFAPGDVVDLKAPVAEALIACGSAEEGGTLKKATKAEAALAAAEAQLAEPRV